MTGEAQAQLYQFSAALLVIVLTFCAEGFRRVPGAAANSLRGHDEYLWVKGSNSQCD
jgi:hypothetical protein